MFAKLGLFSAIFLIQHYLTSAVVVQLPNGKIQGLSGKTTAGNSYNYFLHLRYAKPPTGNLRFELPQELDNWYDTYDGTTEKHICYQVYNDDTRENEDCLFLHVFTPKDLSGGTVAADLPVMVFVHGGGFISGDNSIYKNMFGPNFFIDSNVVLVTIQYRMGPFGFLSLGDSVIPGNLGLHDQNMALKWVQKNIQYFGGNANKVTLFGQSAGAASVSYQVLSPRSKGLFAGAIMESGSALVPWAYQRDQTLLSQKTVQHLPGGSSVNFANSQSVLQFLRNSVTADQIDKASYNMAIAQGNASNTQLSQGFFYAPVIETNHANAFITERQYGAFESGNFNQVPVIMGINAEESVGMDLSDNYFQYTCQNYDSDNSNLVPYDMHVTDMNKKYQIGYSIHNYHVGSGKFAQDKAAAIRLHSTMNFDKGMIKTAQLQSVHAPTYFYEFTYSGTMGNNQYKYYGTGNVTHSEELNYLFSHWYSAQIPDNSNLAYFPEADRNVHYRLLTMWINFAKYQNPTPSQEAILQNTIWPKVNGNNFQYLDIGQNLVIKSGVPKTATFNFWQNLFNQYAVPPLDTF